MRKRSFVLYFLVLVVDIATAGMAQVTVFNPARARDVSGALPFSITSDPPGTGTAPEINPGGIINNASYNNLPSASIAAVASGSIVAIFGSRLTDGTSCLPPSCNPTFGSNGRLNTVMAGAQVTVNGTPAPIMVDANQY